MHNYYSAVDFGRIVGFSTTGVTGAVTLATIFAVGVIVID
jgi:hypothetical protein